MSPKSCPLAIQLRLLRLTRGDRLGRPTPDCRLINN